MDFANTDIPKSIGTTSLSWDLVSFMDEDFFPQTAATNLKIWNGSSFAAVNLKRYNGVTWEDCSIKLYNNSNWV